MPRRRAAPRRARLSPWALAAAVGVLCAQVPVALAVGEAIVPGGAWRLEARLSQDAPDKAIDRRGDSRDLQSYVALPAPGAGTVEGSVTRRVSVLDFNLLYGLSDTWNLAVGLPVGQLDQQSSLRASGGSAALNALVDSLQSTSFTETGDLSVVSLHRTIYTDWNSLVLGYGVSLPSGAQRAKFIGAPTFSLRSPGANLLGTLHFTRYPAIEHSRLDLGLTVELPRETLVDTPTQRRQVLVPGNRATGSAGWEQEFGPLLLGAALRVRLIAANTVAGHLLKDDVKEGAIALSAGYGNLLGLESGRLAFPYQLRVDYERTLGGFNTPIHNRYSVALATYF